MAFEAEEILAILDRCCDAFKFPMLDNGYVYLAATRLSVYRSATDWAIVIEVFGFSPRAGLPDTHIQTFASRLYDRYPPERYVNREAYESYLANNPNNEYRSVFPIHEGPWQDADEMEFIAPARMQSSCETKPYRCHPSPTTGITELNLNGRLGFRCSNCAGFLPTSRGSRSWRRQRNGESASFRQWHRSYNWKNGIIPMWSMTKSGRAVQKHLSKLRECSPPET